MRKILLSAYLFLGFFVLACEDESTNSDGNSLDLDAAIVEQAALGFQFNQFAGTANEISEYTDPDEVDELDLPDFGTAIQLKDNANRLFNESKIYLNKLRLFRKTTADSLLFQYSDTTGTIITRLALYFDSETGIARYEVISQTTNSSHRIQYDSTSIRFNINNLDNQDDDRFLDLFNFQQFRTGLLLKNITSELVATDWALDGEVTAFNAATTSIYSEERKLEKVVASIIFNTDGSGTLSETYYFQDGTNSVHSVTFNNDGTGSFNRTLRNGINTTGSFDAVEDDGQGFYEATTSFPAGFYLLTIFKSASLAFDFIDEQMTGDYKEIITFSDGEIDSVHINLVVSDDNDDYREINLNINRRNGASGQLIINEGDDLSTLDGTWTTWDGFFVLISAEYYGDGSAWLRYEVYRSQSAYNNGLPALTVVEYNFLPDGSGIGNMTHESESYEIELEGNGKGQILKNGASTAIEMYR